MKRKYYLFSGKPIFSFDEIDKIKRFINERGWGMLLEGCITEEYAYKDEYIEECEYKIFITINDISEKNRFLNLLVHLNIEHIKKVDECMNIEYIQIILNEEVLAVFTHKNILKMESLALDVEKLAAAADVKKRITL